MQIVFTYSMNLPVERELALVHDEEAILHLIEKHLTRCALFPGSPHHTAPVMIHSLHDRKQSLLQVSSEKALSPGPLIAFRILSRYVEIHLNLLSPIASEGMWLARVEKAGIARRHRSSPRIPVKPGRIAITRILAHHHTFQSDGGRVPAVVRVNFSIFENRIRHLGDQSFIQIYEKNSPLHDILKEQSAPLLLSTDENSGFLDVETWTIRPLDSRGHRAIDPRISEMRRKSQKNEMYVPIIFVTEQKTQFRAGYLRLMRRQKSFSSEDFLEIDKILKDLQKAIEDSNRFFVKESQAVLDLSRGGLRIQLTDSHLIEAIQNRPGIQFELKAPGGPGIELYGNIRSCFPAKTQDGSSLIGIQIDLENSSPMALQRFAEIVSVEENR